MIERKYIYVLICTRMLLEISSAMERLLVRAYLCKQTVFVQYVSDVEIKYILEGREC